MKIIRQGLCIGDISDAVRCLAEPFPGDECNPVPSAVLSLCDVSGLHFRAAKPGVPLPAHMSVPLLDDDDADLLFHLPGCLSFISEHLQKSANSTVEERASAESSTGLKGFVLVHCHAGVSRSAAVLVAHLMVSEKRSFSGALASLQQASEGARPNDNFCQQLSLFERMGCRLDPSFPEYKLHRLAALAKKRLQGHDSSMLFATELATAADAAPPVAAPCAGDHHEQPAGGDSATGVPGPHAPGQGRKATGEGMGTGPSPTQGAPGGSVGIPNGAGSLTWQEAPGGMGKRDLYRCRKCRALLLTSDNVMPHPEGKDKKAPAGVAKPGAGGPGRSALPPCTSFFIEPLKWMASTVCDGDVEGDISCHKCKGKVGGFNWSGLKCSCGAWFTPGFRVSTAKVDKCPI